MMIECVVGHKTNNGEKKACKEISFLCRLFMLGIIFIFL